MASDDGLDDGPEDLFHAAADHLAQLVSSNPTSVPDSVKLQLYGLYKQATVGPCNTSKPAFWDRTGCSKWTAWHKLGPLSQASAMEQYIELLGQQDPQWLAAAAAAAAAGGTAAAGSSKQGGSTKAGVGGPVFSTLMHNSDQQTEAADGSSSSIHVLAGQPDTASLQACLQEHGAAAVDVRDDQGCTALHFAADRGQTDAVLLLLRAGADINAQDQDGQTPLHYAALCEQLEACKLLLANGADTSITDAEGQTAQQLAPAAWDCWVTAV